MEAVNARLQRTEDLLRELMGTVRILAGERSVTSAVDSPPASPDDTVHTENVYEEKKGEPTTPLGPAGDSGDGLSGAQTAARPTVSVARSLALAGLSSPVTASRNTVKFHTEARITTALPDLPAVPSSGVSADDARRKKEALQKGMMKPPPFDGNMGERIESISTWWKQMGNWARAFDDSDRAMVIKSFLRGPAALWLDSFERQIGRELTVEELADGLTQEYGRETTSDEALQKLETLTMESPGCSTIQGYNATYNSYYNRCSANVQPIAIRCYIKGIAHRYLKWVEMTDEVYTSLPKARAAVVNAVSKYDLLELNHRNHDLQAARASVRKESNGGSASDHSSAVSFSNNYRRSTEGNQVGGKQNLNAFSVLASPDDDDEDREESTRTDTNREAQVAAVSTATRDFPPKQTGLRLTQEQRELLRRERRCYKCHKAGHIRQSCRSQAATVAPVPLNPSAPSRP
jgi:hypothetical protein